MLSKLGRTDILYIKSGRRSDHMLQYGLTIEQKETDSCLASSASAGSQQSMSGKKVLPPRVPRSSSADGIAGNDSQDDVMKTSPAAKKASGNDKQNQKLLRSAATLKLQYHRVVSTQQTLLDALKTDPKWEVLATPKVTETLQNLMGNVIAAATGDFGMLYMNNEVNEVKKSFPKDKTHDFFFALRNLEDSLRPALDALEKEHLRLHRMFRASQV